MIQSFGNNQTPSTNNQTYCVIRSISQLVIKWLNYPVT
jgi:hypothetical protein